MPTGLTADALNREILQVSSQLLESSRQAQQEQDRAREIADSLNQLPQQQTDARRQLNEVERRIGTQTGNNALAQAQNLALQAESARLKALVDELDLAQLSANNRQSCRAPVPSWRKNRASSWMPICRRCAICKTASASGRRKRRWRVPNCWRRTVKTCRRTSPPSLRSTVSSPGR